MTPDSDTPRMIRNFTHLCRLCTTGDIICYRRSLSCIRIMSAEIPQLPKEAKCEAQQILEFLQNYTFVLKHNAGVENKVVDALNQHVIILVVMSAEVTGFERLKEEYES